MGLFRRRKHTRLSSKNQNNGNFLLFFRSLIPEYQLQYYDYMREQALRFAKSIDMSSLPPISFEEAAMIWNFVLWDDPELFYASGGVQGKLINDALKTLSIQDTMYFSDVSKKLGQIEQYRREYKNLISPSDTNYDKVRTAYEYIINMTDYNADTEDNQNMASVFLQKKSCCAGYSHAFQYLLNSVGIPCGYISGYSDSEIKKGKHAWNMCFIDDEPTWIDVTWGDPIYLSDNANDGIVYDYFCIADQECYATHMPDKQIANLLPKCGNNKYDYYVRNGLVFDSYPNASIEPAIQNAFLGKEIGFGKDGHGEIAIKFTNKNAFLSAYNDFIAKNLFIQILSPVLNSYGYRMLQSFHSKNDEMNIIHFQCDFG